MDSLRGEEPGEAPVGDDVGPETAADSVKGEIADQGACIKNEDRGDEFGVAQVGEITSCHDHHIFREGKADSAQEQGSEESEVMEVTEDVDQRFGHGKAKP